MAHLVQNAQIIPLAVPIDLNGAGVVAEWVNMENFNHATLIYCADIGTAGEDPVLTVLQATSAAGAGSKALDIAHVYTKRGAPAINVIGVFTKETDPGDNTFEDAAGGENEQLTVIEIDTHTMDVANGFTHLTMTVNDPGIAGKLACVIAILQESRYGQAVLASAID